MKTILLNAWAWVTGLSKRTLNNLLPVLKTDFGKALDALLPIAIQIVTELITSGKTSTEKKDAAVTALKAQAVTAAVDASTSVLNTIVEVAYQTVKADSSTSTASNN